MQRKLSTSLVSGLAFLLFLLSVFCPYVLNIDWLNLLLVNSMLILFPAGVTAVAVFSVIVSWKMLSPNTTLRKSTIFLIPCLLIAAASLLLVVGCGTAWPILVFVYGTPVLVCCGQIIACVALVCSRVSRVCALLLVASVILAVVAAPIAGMIGSEKDPDIMHLLLHPAFLSWLVCVSASMFLSEASQKLSTDDLPGTAGSEASVRRTATILWTLSAAVWTMVLIYTVGIVEKGSF